MTVYSIRKFIIAFTLSIISLFSYRLNAKEVVWKNVGTGLELASSSYNNARQQTVNLLVYKIDLKHNQLKLLTAEDLKQQTASVKEMALNVSAILAINGGFFDFSSHPLGLLIKDSKQVNPWRSISWWPVFWVNQNGSVNIQNSLAFKLSTKAKMAIQSGPRLVNQFEVVKGLKENFSRKSFLAILSDRELLIGVTQSGEIDSLELAKILSNDFRVRDAMCLDGGSSTQLYFNSKKDETWVKGWVKVPNSLGVLPIKLVK